MSKLLEEGETISINDEMKQTVYMEAKPGINMFSFELGFTLSPVKAKTHSIKRQLILLKKKEALYFQQIRAKVEYLFHRHFVKPDLLSTVFPKGVA